MLDSWRKIVDYDEIILDLSCFQLDPDQEQLRLLKRRYGKMTKQAQELKGTEAMNTETVTHKYAIHNFP